MADPVKVVVLESGKVDVYVEGRRILTDLDDVEEAIQRLRRQGIPRGTIYTVVHPDGYPTRSRVP